MFSEWSSAICSSCLSPLTWMYSRTRRFSRGAVIMLPMPGHWIAQDWRMSATTVNRNVLVDGRALTEVGDRNDVYDSPRRMLRVAFHRNLELSSGPALSAVTRNHIANVYCLCLFGCIVLTGGFCNSHCHWKVVIAFAIFRTDSQSLCPSVSLHGDPIHL